MAGSLLSHIAGNFISQYENVANSSICYLLNQYEAARLALKAIASIEETPSHYITELSTKSNGRPDVTGLGVDGNKVLIIEGKFWANLTENQPENYLKELADGGKLLFLAPKRRLPSLKLQIQKRPGGLDERVILFSWLDLLELIESENAKAFDNGLASDLVQLKALCARMDVEGMPPLSMTDLDPMNGRVCSQFAEVIDDCNVLMRKDEEYSFKGTRSAGFQHGYGFYFRAYGHEAWLGLSTLDWFTKKSQTPIWLTVYPLKGESYQQIYCDLKNYDSNNSYQKENLVLYAVLLEPGMDRQQVVECIVSKVNAVLSVVLKAAVSSAGAGV